MGALGYRFYLLRKSPAAPLMRFALLTTPVLTPGDLTHWDALRGSAKALYIALETKANRLIGVAS
jgi:hypothetical protein